MIGLKLPGDADIAIDGVKYRLRLTLGALAYMEEEIGGGDFQQLVARLGAPSPLVLLHLLNALIIGGGADMTVAYLKARDIDAHAAALAIGKAFHSLADDRSGAEPPSPDESDIGESFLGKVWPRRKQKWLREGTSPEDFPENYHGRDGFATR